MRWPHYSSRTCGPCGCAIEECECIARTVREMTFLRPTDELLEEIAEQETHADAIAATIVAMK